jgi:hypothetical protein
VKFRGLIYVKQCTLNAAMLTKSLHVYLHVAAAATYGAATITADVLRRFVLCRYRI